jgi:hypothetical protein
MRQTFTLLFSIILFTSCVSQTKMLQLMNTGTKLNSTHAGTINSYSNLTTKVSSDSIQGIRQWPQIKQQKFHFIPLILVTNWNSTYNCQIGIRDIQENLNQNLVWTLNEKINNSEVLKTRLTSDNQPYTLEVSVDTIKSHIPFVSKGTVVFALVAYSYWLREGVDEASISLTSSYKLSYNGQVLKQGKVKTSRTLAAEKNNTGSKKKYMERYLNGYFTELNRTLYDNVGAIVQRIEENPITGQ